MGVLCGHHIPNDWASRAKLCIKFCFKLEHSSAETIWMIQKAAAMGNWWLAASSQQHTCSCITSRPEIFWQNIKSPRWLNPATAQIWCPVTSGLSPNQNRLWKGRDFRCWWDLEKYNRVADSKWENCVRSQGAYFEGDWGIIVLCTMFLVSCIFFNTCLYFS